MKFKNSKKTTFFSYCEDFEELDLMYDYFWLVYCNYLNYLREYFINYESEYSDNFEFEIEDFAEMDSLEFLDFLISLTPENISKEEEKMLNIIFDLISNFLGSDIASSIENEESALVNNFPIKLLIRRSGANADFGNVKMAADKK